MARDISIIVNQSAAQAPSAANMEILKRSASEHGFAPKFIFAANREEVTERAREAAQGGAEIVAAVGSDDTLSAAAAGIMGTSAKLAVLPLGIFNHFAADLGIPVDVIGALTVINTGTPEAVDVGEVNRQVFLNNSSIGLYPRLAHEQEEEQRKNHGHKFSAFSKAFWKVMRKYPALILRTKLHGQTLTRKTSFIFVGNNEYILEGLRTSRRNGLQQGYLDIGVAEHSSRQDLIKVFLNAIFGKFGKEPYFGEYRVSEAQVDSRRRFLPVILDGQVKIMRTPLNFRIIPQALQVILPKAKIA